jgi:endonuclease IV
MGSFLASRIISENRAKSTPTAMITAIKGEITEIANQIGGLEQNCSNNMKIHLLGLCLDFEHWNLFAPLDTQSHAVKVKMTFLLCF